MSKMCPVCEVKKGTVYSREDDAGDDGGSCSRCGSHFSFIVEQF